jgi:hypothetical protein
VVAELWLFPLREWKVLPFLPYLNMKKSGAQQGLVLLSSPPLDPQRRRLLLKEFVPRSPLLSNVSLAWN